MRWLHDSPTDFWGVVMPAWVGAGGTFAASIVAVIALIIGQRARGSARNIATGLNRDSEPTALTVDDLAAAAREAGVAAGTIARMRIAAHPWAFERDGDTLTFRNQSGERMTVTSFDMIGGLAVVYRGDIPLDVPDGASFQLQARRTLGGGEVRGITVSWVMESGQQLSRTYYL